MNLLTVCLTLAVLGPDAESRREFVFEHEHVLGTSAEIRVVADDLAHAKRVEGVALAEIDRLDNILSAYYSDSEFCRWQRGELTRLELSADLQAVLAAARHWQQVSQGAFDIHAGEWSQLWRQAEASQQLPTAAQRQQVLTRVAAGQGRVGLDGLAKGYILDRVCEAVGRDCPSVSEFSVNIGGDLRRLGSRPFQIGVTDPIRSAVNDAPLTVINSQAPFALATSGGYRRGFELQGRRLSHVVDPRTGWPVSHILSASVLASDATTADALATALNVLTPKQGLELIASLEDTECCLVAADGRLWCSAGWPGTPPEKTSVAQQDGMGYVLARIDEKSADRTSADAKSEPRKSDADKAQSGLLVDFELRRPQGRRYRRPYFAIWLEDADGFPVKTAVLWMQTEQPGPRWHRDLTRWYRNDRMRRLVEEKALIGTISGATRGPGKYKARFDGTDNSGQPLPEGRYTLCIEAAREHGTYQIVRKVLQLGATPIARTSLKGNVEVGGLAVEYRPWKSDPADGKLPEEPKKKS